MDVAAGKTIELIFGRWRSQILYTGVRLGVFDALAAGPATAAEAASELHVDSQALYRLMRALGAIGLLEEDDKRTFSLTSMGDLLRTDHPHSLRSMTLLEEGPEHYAAWKHLPALIREGKQDGFAREFGQPAFTHASRNPDYGKVFNDAMSSFSTMDNMMLLEALKDYDFSGISRICDVGGGQGYALCNLLAAVPHLQGTVLDLPNVVADKKALWAGKMDLEQRCTYVPGDMFDKVPAAEAYLIKRILHDWNDAECHTILSATHRAASKGAKVLIVEQVVPGASTPHFSKLFDVHMLIWGTGRERTEGEYAALLKEAGWKYLKTWYPASKMLGVVEAAKA